MKGLSAVLNSSSQYWKETTISNVDNFCSCSRGQIEVENETADHIYNSQQINNKTSSPQIGGVSSASISDPIECFKKAPENPGHVSNKRNWTPEEDSLLLSLTSSNFKHNWKSLASHFENKSPQQVSYRWTKLNSRNDTKWTRNEDIQLLELVESLGEHWKAISLKMTGRSTGDIQTRYETKLNPNLKRSKFDKEEDEQILLLCNKFGNQWDSIAKHLKNRSALMIKNRYYSCLKKKFGKDNTNKEDFTETHQLVNTYLVGSIASSHNKINNNFNENKRPSICTKPQNNLPISIEDTNSYFYESLLKSSSEFTHNYLENETQLYNENILGTDFNNYNYGNYDMDIDRCTQSDMPDLNKINIGLERSSGISKETSTVKTWKDDRGSSKDFEMRYDDRETNYIPQDLIKLDTDSPKLNEMDHNNFNDEYWNVFKSKNNSFESKDNSEEENEKNKDQSSKQKKTPMKNSKHNFGNKFNFDNENLMNQYNMLEQVFSKVQQVNMDQAMQDCSFKDVKTSTLNKKLDEKRENLSLELTNLKNEYVEIQSNTLSNNVPNNDIIRLSLVKQIEILMELIKTTKYKISLLNSNNSPE